MNLRKRADSDMLTKLFFKLLPVQILVVAMSSVNYIIDGAVAGRFVSPQTVGVIGLYYSMINILSAVGAILLGGTSVLCGKYMGRGEMQKTQGIFSLNLTVTFAAGLLISLASFAFPGAIADALGVNVQLRASLITYILGYAVGIIPQLLAQQLASFLQLERRSKLGYAGIGAMILSNIVLDLLFVAVLDMDVWGLALATALSNWIYFLILVSYYFTKKAQLRYHFKLISWKLLPEMLKIGLPGAMLVFCLALRGLVINRVLLHYSGQDGLSAMSAFNMVSCLFIALCLGMGAVVRMLTSIFIGEEDRDSIKTIIRIVFTKGLALSVLMGAVVFVLSGRIARIFFADSTANVFLLTRQIFRIYALCIPLTLICNVSSNYLQASGHNLFVNVQSVFDGFFSMVIPALILAPGLGAMGVWLSNPIGILLTILLVPAYAWIFWKRLPRTMDEWLFFKPSFGATDADRLELTIRSMEDVVQTSVQVQRFCEAHCISKRTSYYSALCLEEMAGNVVRHGFAAGRRENSVVCRVVFSEEGILLRIKDDCIPFNPTEWMKMVAPEDPVKNIGIRMVYRIAKDVNYQQFLGLNVLTILLRNEAAEGE